MFDHFVELVLKMVAAVQLSAHAKGSFSLLVVTAYLRPWIFKKETRKLINWTRITKFRQM